MSKRYYWLRLKDDFFDSLRIKKLRRLAGGDTYTIIYLKMQLKAMKHDGIIEYTGIEKTLAEEIALDIGEDSENVAVTLGYLETTGLCEIKGDDIFLPYAVENTGSETASTQRSRESRARKVLQCNNIATQLQQQCNADATDVQRRDIDIEREIDIDRDICKGKSRFAKPTIEEVQAYISEKGLSFDAETFVNFYEAKGWMIGKNKMKNWKAACNTWERHENKGKHESLQDFVDSWDV